mmetsp:Transcript_10811/g.16295  ORF Transcript_10811/g.16295 Transcript_10811/m.16295 type:complete len:160 (+) Transcript_10811:2-481(+)
MDLSQSLDKDEFMELARVLILATLTKERPHDVYKYLLAANTSGMGKDGGLPTKPLVSGAAEAKLGSGASGPAAAAPPPVEGAAGAPAAEEGEAPMAQVPTKESAAAEEAAAAVMETFGDIDGSPEQQKSATLLQSIQRKKEAKKIVEAKKAEKAAAPPD